MTNVFISWSGEVSKAIAEELRSWIPSVLQFAQPYFTPNDIEKGTKWGTEISAQLASSNIGIICLTKDNLNRPWILFEAGALSKDLEKSKVCSVLFGVENTDLSGPLTTFQTTEFDKVDFRKMMVTINDSGGERKLSTETFNSVFDKWWPDLQAKISSILEKDRTDANSNIREDRELLEEILTLAREQSHNSILDDSTEQVPQDLLEDWLETVEIIEAENSKNPSLKINQACEKQLRMISFLIDRKRGISHDLKKRLELAMKTNNNFIPF